MPFLLDSKNIYIYLFIIYIFSINVLLKWSCCTSVPSVIGEDKNNYLNLCCYSATRRQIFANPLSLPGRIWALTLLGCQSRTSAQFSAWACYGATRRLMCAKLIFGQYFYRFCPKITPIGVIKRNRSFRFFKFHPDWLRLASKVCKCAPFWTKIMNTECDASEILHTHSH